MDKNLKNILIIDDNQNILKPLSMLLQGRGYSVVATTRGTDPVVTQKPYADVILLDLRLEDIKGQDLCLQIKKNPDTKHIPVILFSADNRLKEIAKESLADDFIAKPFDVESLLKKITKHTS